MLEIRRELHSRLGRSCHHLGLAVSTVSETLPKNCARGAPNTCTLQLPWSAYLGLYREPGLRLSPTLQHEMPVKARQHIFLHQVHAVPLL
jgi:hypothetical protein